MSPVQPTPSHRTNGRRPRHRADAPGWRLRKTAGCCLACNCNAVGYGHQHARGDRCDRDGAFETSDHDGSRDSYAEWMTVDTSVDGHDDTWVVNQALAGYGRYDELARSVAAAGAFSILAVGNVPVAWPVGG